MEEGKVRRSDLGTPQGGVISPLLANIYLNYFDRLWEKHGSGLGELTRYADDFVVVCKTKKDWNVWSSRYTRPKPGLSAYGQETKDSTS